MENNEQKIPNAERKIASKHLAQQTQHEHTAHSTPYT